ncbi:hypothetical protein [Enterococcus plantarum]|uniref:hypothetical protein n=1 Tax=Enterococcus plantarum TaxID=1077675 RepID=UPI001A8EEF6F|nr:hypothetical protein [Enterococcus plantarum]MBO0423830.1 hypothetical protein [Enterococcus plantarum]
MNEEMLYLVNFLASIKNSKSYVVNFEFNNYIYLTFSLQLEFVREGFRDNAVCIERDAWKGLFVNVGSSYNPIKTIKIDSDWVGEALVVAQHELAKMNWVPIEIEKDQQDCNPS